MPERKMPSNVKDEGRDLGSAMSEAPAVTASEVLRRMFVDLPGVREADVHLKSYAISRGGEPRWLLPENAKDALPVLRTWHPHNLKSKIQWSVIQFACKSRTLSYLPGVSVHSTDGNLDYWKTRLPGYSDKWQPVIYVGNASHTRKLVAFFVDEDGKVRSVVKVPLCEAAKPAILNEASILRRLESRLALPRVQFVDDQCGIAGQSWMEGKSVGRKFSEKHLELLANLANPNLASQNQGASTRLCDHRDTLGAAIERLDLPLSGDVSQRALDLLDDSAQLPAFVEHRDFAPWNVRMLSDGRLTLIDWEWAEADGLPWQDICHFFYIQDYLFHGPGNVWEELTGNALLRSYASRFGIASTTIRALTMCYLLRTLCLVWENREPGRAEHLARQINALLNSKIDIL